MDITITTLPSSNAPGDYVLEEPLTEAVKLAIALNKPLLVTGAPGTGKTQLAFKIADVLSKDGSQFKFLGEPWIFNTKTTSTARDLFYQYAAIDHFQRKGAAKDEQVSISDYIQLNALGAAIAQTKMGAYAETLSGKDEKETALKNIEDDKVLRKISKDRVKSEPMSSVVLIDEIDKAPRDFPNDLLNEIENYQFYIQELDITIKAAPPDRARVVIIMTSNFEKNLPPAFLRRCLFYHIPTPKGDALLKIVAARMRDFLKARNLALTDEEIKARYNAVVTAFDKWGEALNDKAPATAELIEWLKALELKRFFESKVSFDKLTEDQKTILRYTFPVLAKSKDDFDLIANFVK